MNIYKCISYVTITIKSYDIYKYFKAFDTVSKLSASESITIPIYHSLWKRTLDSILKI